MALSLITKAWPIVMQTGRKFVLVALCDAANDDGQCFLCVETVAYKCGMGVRTVQGHLIDLEKFGFIWREERMGRSSIYSVDIEMLDGAEKSALWVKRQLMKRTPAKSAGVKKPQTPAETAPAPAKSAEAPAETAPIPIAYPFPSRNTRESAGAPTIPQPLLNDFLEVRKAKRVGPLTDTALAGIAREGAKAGLDLVQSITVCCELGWASFNAGWYANRQPAAMTAANSETAYQRSMRLRVAEVSPLLARPAPGAPPAINATDYFQTIPAIGVTK